MSGPALQELLGGSSRQEIDRALNVLQVCRRCGLEYREKTNMGTWRCRGFHPLAAFVTANSATYQCCGRHIGERGCVPADHTSFYEWNLTPERVDDDAADIAQKYEKTIVGKNPRPKWHYDKAKRAWYIQRIDVEEHERVVERVKYRQIEYENKVQQPV